MGAISEAMASAARAAGAEIETGAPVREVIVEKGRAAGVILEDGRAIRAGTVAANVNPKLLYDRMVPKDAVAADFAARMARWRCGSGTFRMNVALSRAAELHRPARLRACRPPYARASSSPRASPIWTGPITTPARTAGAASR